MSEAKNRFIVIEGLDGSGKSTQIDLLLKYLKGTNTPYRYLHFPRTEDGFFGDLIARFLRGDLGPLASVHPYLVAMIYAGNRYDSAVKISDWLREGLNVIADRYVVSNIAFQCAKLTGKKDQEALRDWILDLEYRYYRIPRPDINVFLDVPFRFTERKLTQARKGNDRDYLEGKTDIHEQDLEFQKKVRNVYLGLAGTGNDVQILDCRDEHGEMLPPGDIFEKIRELLFSRIST
jgi:dTMP kinase